MRKLTRVSSVLLVAVGVAIIVRAILDDGSSPAFRVLLGVLFIAAGAGRLYLERERRGRA